MNSKLRSQTIRKSDFYIYNKDGTIKEDIEKAWLESRIISKKDVEEGTIDSVMSSSRFPCSISHRVADAIALEGSAMVIISYQIHKSFNSDQPFRVAFIRLVSPEKLRKINLN